MRFHGGAVGWYYHQTYGGGMEAKQGKMNDNSSRQYGYGFVVSQNNAVEWPGIAYWAYAYSLDDGSAHVLPRVTAGDSRFTRNGLPHPDEL